MINIKQLFTNVTQLLADDFTKLENPSCDRSVRSPYCKQPSIILSSRNIPMYLSEATIASMSAKDRQAYLKLLQEKELRVAELIFPLSPKNKLSM